MIFGHPLQEAPSCARFDRLATVGCEVWEPARRALPATVTRRWQLFRDISAGKPPQLALERCAFLRRTGVQLECGHSAPARMATAAGTAPETPFGVSAKARGRLAFPDRASFHSRYHNHRILAGSS
jgi:hypothetical protein